MKIQICIVTIVIFWATTVNAYDNKFVHLLINESASRQSLQLMSVLPNIGFPNGINETLMGKKIWKWFQDGGLKEDEPLSRTFNHFHDPTKTWDQAGLKGSWIGCSSILWAQNKCNNANDKWSWAKAREYYYAALSSKDKSIREQNFADTFRALGQQMHLLSDAAVPEHTRNDIHVFPLLDTPDQSFPQIGKWTYETWCKRNVGNLNTAATAIDYAITNISQVSGLVPISNFWDTTPSAGTSTNPIGLAEYTNFNFVSGDTIFKDFDYPQRPISFNVIDPVVAEDGKTDYIVYFKGTTSDSKTINHLASTGYLWSELSQVSAYAMDDSRFVLDDACFRDFASILVPKAISYSAGLLDYFFRGKIELSLPARGVYALAAPDGQFSEIRVRAKNATVSGDDMNNGQIQLVVHYMKALSDPFQSQEVAVGPDKYIVVPEKTSSLPPEQRIKEIPKGTPVELTFDLSADPETLLPLWATNVTIQVVYKGQLGQEADAVAVGFKDISEPTPIDIVNNMDHICINGNYMVAGSTEAIDAVDFPPKDGKADYDVYPHDLNNVYMAFNGNYASSSNYSATFASIPHGSYGRVFLLSDYSTDSTPYPLIVSGAATVVIVDQTNDIWYRYVTPWGYYIYPLQNDDEYFTDDLLVVRNLKSWWYVHYENQGYPTGTVCNNTTNAQPDLSGPVAVTLQ